MPYIDALFCSGQHRKRCQRNVACHRYVTANAVMSAGWRQCPTSVPPEMHHRPRWFVQHMLESELKSQDITSDMVQTIADNGFRVRSATNVGK